VNAHDGNAKKDPWKGELWVIFVWILSLSSFFFIPCGLVAVIIAYIGRPMLRGTFAHSHMTYAIWTFWLSWTPTTLIVILIFRPFFLAVRADSLDFALAISDGMRAYYLLFLAVMAALAIWYLYRCIRGLVLASHMDPVPYPRGLF
jgi:uncharacterized membrane protein